MSHTSSSQPTQLDNTDKLDNTLAMLSRPSSPVLPISKMRRNLTKFLTRRPATPPPVPVYNFDQIAIPGPPLTAIEPQEGSPETRPTSPSSTTTQSHLSDVADSRSPTPPEDSSVTHLLTVDDLTPLLTDSVESTSAHTTPVVEAAKPTESENEPHTVNVETPPTSPVALDKHATTPLPPSTTASETASTHPTPSDLAQVPEAESATIPAAASGSTAASEEADDGLITQAMLDAWNEHEDPNDPNKLTTLEKVASRWQELRPAHFREPLDRRDHGYNRLCDVYRGDKVFKTAPLFDPADGYIRLSRNLKMLEDQTFKSADELKSYAESVGASIVAKSAGPGSYVHCHICKEVIRKDAKTLERHCGNKTHVQHLASIYRHAMPIFNWWTCPICDKTMRDDFRSSHKKSELEGKIQRKRKADENEVEEWTTDETAVPQRPRKRRRGTRHLSQGARQTVSGHLQYLPHFNPAGYPAMRNPVQSTFAPPSTIAQISSIPWQPTLEDMLNFDIPCGSNDSPVYSTADFSQLFSQACSPGTSTSDMQESFLAMLGDLSPEWSNTPDPVYHGFNTAPIDGAYNHANDFTSFSLPQPSSSPSGPTSFF